MIKFVNQIEIKPYESRGIFTNVYNILLALVVTLSLAQPINLL